MSLHIYNDKETLANGLAEWIAATITFTLRKQEGFTFVLSGGSTPKILYKILATEYRNKVEWNRVHFFWGDERAVPYGDERNNARMASETLLTPLNISADHIHLMRTDISPKNASKEYDALLKNRFKDNKKIFDLTLLGMGDDGHTLSLFPGFTQDTTNEQWVTTTVNHKENLERITLLPNVVNRSANIIFMVSGEEKAGTLHAVLQGKEDHKNLPAQLINPVAGNLFWFIDYAAAGKIEF